MSPREISPEDAQARLDAGAILIDVREDHERALGSAKGARGIDHASIAAAPNVHLPDRAAEVLLICQGGRRSLMTAQLLADNGYANVVSITGGTSAWEARGLPMSRPDIDADFSDRYSRHLVLPEVGLAGQQRLAEASILLVGAGGLGSPAALYLAAAGVGTLRLVDDDVVDRSNLQRQVLHTEARIGQLKVASAAVALSALNPRTRIEAIGERLTSANVEQHLQGVDVAIDGADNFPARYLLNDACVHLGVPLVYGAVHRFHGQASVFDAGRRRGIAPCYRCLFAEPPSADAAPNCAQAGVLGVLPGVIGLLQATEAIKLILGIGESLAGRLLQFDALTMRFRETRLAPDPECAVCAPGRKWQGYVDYQRFCTAG
ncbi:molybdopterin-synthase adenylyltransferase MoeB [Cognatiluteimonas profundi]|uniref:molybdopterin-synthase adenylyltransferase MoeB n=1 Tax=Cognatiluteimonas profundi TaxID=2594501 RepID=UPI00131C838E|nr:molybdopterin-synthase adenylyltransferase MoeB [Lysobacter profundi]